MSEQVKAISYKKLFRFFFPLAATPIMIGLTHSIINAALARLPFPEESIAVFTVVKGIVMIISSPTLMSLQLVVTYVDDRDSYKQIIRFTWAVGGILFSLLMLLAYTPLGEWIFRNMIGLTADNQISFAYAALRIACFLPLVQVLRNTHQGIAIAVRKTNFFVPGIVLRLIIISLFLWYAVRTRLVLGVVAGSLTWVTGIGIEGFFILGSLIYYFNNLDLAIEKMPKRNKDNPVLAEIVKFFIPLGLMISLGAFLQPIIQSGIARSNLATQSLAAYGVAWGLIATISGPIGMLHQLSLVYTEGTGDINWKPVMNFSLLTGLVLLLIISVIALSPLGNWLLIDVIGVSDEIARIAQRVLLAFALFPLIRSFRESYWGLLMNRRTTSLIGIAKIVNIVVVASTIFFGILKLSVQPAVFGALAFTLGEGVESILIWYYAVKYPERNVSR